MLQIQTSLDRAGDFSLIIKLGRKHNTYIVSILNYDYNDTQPVFNITTWSYDHTAPYTCQVEIHIESLEHHEHIDNQENHNSSLSSQNKNELNLISPNTEPTFFLTSQPRLL